MPASGARSGTRPSRSSRGAGDGRVGAKRSLECGHGAPVEQLPIMVGGGKSWYSCPACGAVSRALR
jgi:hypothetical protein